MAVVKSWELGRRMGRGGRMGQQGGRKIKGRLKMEGGPRTLSVIVVPDFKKPGIAFNHTQSWVDSMMPLDGIQAQVFHFHYEIAVPGRSIWRQLSDKGEDLLRIFGRNTGGYQLLDKPVILIGHGLGGLIIKQALRVLSDPIFRPHGKNLLNMIAGVVFFGTPHTTTKHSDQWFRLTRLLSLAGKLPKRFMAQSEADAKAAAIICEEFEQSGLEATVLSIYETKPTKVKTGRWKPKESVRLVDKALAETWAKKEKLLDNPVSHENESTRQNKRAFGKTRSLKFQSIADILMTQFLTFYPVLDMVHSPLHASSSLGLDSSLTLPPSDSSNANMGSSLPSDFDFIPSNDMGDYVQDESESNTWPCYLWDRREEKRGFVGREDTFKAIDDCFFVPTSSDTEADMQQLPCCCISGLGGMGKTQTATQYAIARQKNFDAIFFIQAENSAKLSEGFSRIAQALGLSDDGEKRAEEADLVVSRSKALKWLSSPKFSAKASGERTTTREPNWLLVFDNAEDTSILRDYWPVGNVGCILVTTRDATTSHFLRSQSHVTHVYLDRLDTAPASQLLLQLSYAHPNETNIKDASGIVDRLGGLPLAIEQVAAYVYVKRMTLREFLTLYDKTLRERRKRNTGSGSGSGSWSYEIAASWALESLGDAASSLLRVYSFLDPDGIQDSILTDPSAKSYSRALPQDYPDEGLPHIDARGKLLKSSLIQLKLEDPVMIRMHRLVQDISLARMTPPQIAEVFSFIVAVIFEGWPFTQNNWDHQAGGWSRQEVLLKHIIRLSHIAKAYDVSGLEVSLKRKFITLLSSGGWYRQERGDFDSGIPLFELGIKICETSPSDFLDLRADLSFGLGGATCDTNRWAKFLEHANDQLHYRLLSDTANGVPPSSNTAIAYSELGIAQALMKQYEEGVRNCDTAIELYATQPDVIDGSFFPAFPHIHRALALVGAGRPQEGERGLLDLIAWHEARFDPQHTEFK
ncbi:hypothetical protein CDV31_004870 [Fusarium ambrosium]|uniref:DUF7779 domain-containing protein n=1 Tax=Fusarium ambrosium TaxID=131363 RepID=A0A428UN67_9HYPO|nr:hypothetical protein CDV31_004870 [Fusarium ambrosium]